MDSCIKRIQLSKCDIPTTVRFIPTSRKTNPLVSTCFAINSVNSFVFALLDRREAISATTYLTIQAQNAVPRIFALPTMLERKITTSLANEFPRAVCCNKP